VAEADRPRRGALIGQVQHDPADLAPFSSPAATLARTLKHREVAADMLD